MYLSVMWIIIQQSNLLATMDLWYLFLFLQLVFKNYLLRLINIMNVNKVSMFY